MFSKNLQEHKPKGRKQNTINLGYIKIKESLIGMMQK